MRIYISGPLQGSHNLAQARRLYETLARMVEATGHEAYVPHLATDPVQAAHMSAKDVYETDLAAIRSADAVIAHIGLPSTGVGAELAIAAASGRRVLGLKRPGEPGSRFADGLILDADGNVALFTSDAELDLIVRRWLSELREWSEFTGSGRLTPRALV